MILQKGITLTTPVKTQHFVKNAKKTTTLLPLNMVDENYY